MMKFTRSTTPRGFELVQFHDYYDVLCDIQRSSLANTDCIWFGVRDVDPKIMACKTMEGGTGWVKYPIPDDVLLNSRMHLTRKQSIILALRLLWFGLFNKV